MPQGVHAKDQTAFRLDPELRARLKARAEKEGVTMTDYVSEAIEEKLARGITTSAAAPAAVSPPAPAASFLAAEDEQPQQAGKNCKHRNMRIGKGVCPDCNEWVVK